MLAINLYWILLMVIFVPASSGPMSLSKQCRSYQCSNFCLKVVADTSDVTIWFPSDFKGQIRYCGQPTFSISNVGGALWALYDAVRRGTLTFALWDTAQRCTVLYSFPQRDSVGPKIRNCWCRRVCRRTHSRKRSVTKECVCSPSGAGILE